MSEWRRVMSAVMVLGLAVTVARVAPVLWETDPISCVICVTCVVFVGVLYVLEAVTGRKFYE